MISFAQRLRRWRESREGMSKAELARAVGVTRQAIGNWESGGGDPTLDHVNKIAAAIGVSLPVFWGEPPGPNKGRTAS